MGKEGSGSKKRRKENDPAGSSGAGRKRRTMNSNASATPTFYQEYCELPFTLSSILVDEFDCITRKDLNSRRSLHVLPARVTVKQVLQHYERKRTSSSGSSSMNDEEGKKNKDQILRFCKGLALLFDDALPVCLLYREERPQYESLQHDETLRLKRPCEIYGSTFLLRLLQRLPTILRAEPNKEMDELGPVIADLIVLLQKNRQACFKESYREPRKHELFSWEIDCADAENEDENQ
mmetsp:Transcript_22429/g.52939  ORF Transcript_22429/g.52939 Transcript_22429/m.52939 type:complete len:236 (+) Transcript_22429:137-844(+)